MTTPKKKTLQELLESMKARPALPPHDPNAPPSASSSSSSPPTTAKPKLPKGLTDGLMGAALGHAADTLLSTTLGSSPKSGLGSFLLGGLSKMLSGAVKDTNPETAATLDAIAAGAMVSGAMKAASHMRPQPEPLIEEAQKAAAEMAETEPAVVEAGPCRCTCGPCQQELHVACNFQCDDARRKGDAVPPLVEEAQLAVTHLASGTEPQFIEPEPLVEEARRAVKEPQ